MNRELENWQERNIGKMSIEDMIEQTARIEKREAWKEHLAAFAESLAGALVLTLFAFLAWLFLASTPPQMSAEAEAFAEELEATFGK